MAHFSAADPVVILSYARTPMGAMQGVLADVSATDLGATAVRAYQSAAWSNSTFASILPHASQPLATMPHIRWFRMIVIALRSDRRNIMIGLFDIEVSCAA